MALQAKQVHVAELQHVWIRSSVCQVAGLAPINLDRRMLEDKWSLLVYVTFEADRILRGRSPYLLWPYRAMHVVAIAALDEPFVYSMVERHIELGFLLEMACVAKLGLCLYQQELRFFRVMR